MNEEQQAISQKVEQNVRILIGDLYMQILVLRATLEAQQQPQHTNGQDHSHAHEKRQAT